MEIKEEEEDLVKFEPIGCLLAKAVKFQCKSQNLAQHMPTSDEIRLCL